MGIERDKGNVPIQVRKFPCIPNLFLPPPLPSVPIDITPPDIWTGGESGNMPILKPGNVYNMPIWPLHEQLRWDEAETLGVIFG
jgi:hypothetical protein